MFGKLQKVTNGFVVLVRKLPLSPFVCMEQLRFHWTDSVLFDTGAIKIVPLFFLIEQQHLSFYMKT
jgi:hypothetical protein